MATQMNTIAVPEQTNSNTSFSRLLWVTPLAWVASTLANLTLYWTVGSLYPEVTAWAGASQEQIIGANAVYLLIGTVIFALICRWSARPARNVIVIATVGLLLSLVMPITAGMGYGPPEVASASQATVITLSLMHVLSYAIIVPLFVCLGLE
ncbi:MAG: DUF6069 family protein [Chloroflexota bacterium]